MTGIALEKETQNYWALLKDASDQVKLALISLLSDSIRLAHSKPKKAPKTPSATEIRDQKTKEVLAKLPKIKKSELQISPEVMAVVANVPEMDADVDYDKIKYDYLMEKYG